MGYVLVSLVGDEATVESHKIAEHVANRRSTDFFWLGDDPPKDDIKRAVSALFDSIQVPTGVVFGHDGASR